MAWFQNLSKFFRKGNNSPHRRKTPFRPTLAEVLEDRSVPALIPVTGAHDLVFDSFRQILYITTDTGTIERANPNTSTLGLPINVGLTSRLFGADIAPSGNFLYVADGNPLLLAVDAVQKIDLNTLAPTAVIGFPSATFGEVGAFDVAIGSNNLAIVTARKNAAGAARVRQIDLATDTATLRNEPGLMGGNAQLTRTSSRNRIMLQEFNNLNGPIYTYASGTNTFSTPAFAQKNLDTDMFAINRNGTLFAMELGNNVAVFDANYNIVQNFPNLNGGIGFHPLLDLMFIADTATNQIRAYDTNTWKEKFRFSAEETIFPSQPMGVGTMAFSSSGNRLFMITTSGVRNYLLPVSTGIASTLSIEGYPEYAKGGTVGSVTVRALDPAGNVATGYRGTVRFSVPSDGSVSLPLDYTFTAADNGVKVFSNVALRTTGTHNLRVTDLFSPALTASQSGIQIHNNALTPLIPIAGARDIISSPNSNSVYITTSSGKVQRFDINTQSIGMSYAASNAPVVGGDVTADGAYLYVAEAQRNAIKGSLRKIDTVTGAVSVVDYDLDSREGGAFDVKIASNNRAIFVTSSETITPGLIAPRDVDLASDTVSKRTDLANVGRDSFLYRGSDRSRIFLQSNNNVNGPIYSYTAVSDSFGPGANTSQIHQDNLATVNRNGTLTAMELGTNVAIFGPSNQAVQTLFAMGGGLVFSPTDDTLFVVDPTADQIVAFDSLTWDELYRINIPENVGDSRSFGTGTMGISADGNTLFLITPLGIRQFAVPGATSVPAKLSVDGFPRFIASDVPGEFTVTVRNAKGGVVTNYTGTVRVTVVTDPGAADVSNPGNPAPLPITYTFQPGDLGVHKFKIALHTVGIHSIQVADIANSTVLGTQANINVHAPNPAYLPITDAKDMVFDPTRRILYISTDRGVIERYDEARETLLSPIKVSRTPLNGLDLVTTVNGTFLYVMDSQKNAVQGALRKVNVDTGAVVTLSFPLNNFETGGWDVVLTNSGVGFFDTLNTTNGAVSLRRIDLTNDSITSIVPPVTINSKTGMTRSSDGTKVYFFGANDSTGPVFSYDAPTATFGTPSQLGGPLDHALAAVNRDKTLVAVRFGGSTVLLNPTTLQAYKDYPSRTGSVVFDPSRDLFYLADTNTTTLYTISTVTLDVVATQPLPEFLGSITQFGNGISTITDDSYRIFLRSDTGIALVPLPPNPVHAPTGISLTTAIIAENSPLNTEVGTFNVADITLGEVHTLSLVFGIGSDDNASFKIVGNKLRTNVPLDFETKSIYTIRVRAVDSSRQAFETDLKITVGDVNEAPTAVALSNSTVQENAAPNIAIGTLSSTDPDTGDTFTYTLVAGVGDTDNGSFQIVGNELRAPAGFDFEGPNVFSIRVRSTDAGNNSREQVFEIRVTNVNEVPVDIVVAPTIIEDSFFANEAVAAFTAVDPDANNTFTYSLVPGAVDNALFTIVGNELRAASALNLQNKPFVTVRVQAKDQGNLAFTKDLLLTVNIDPDAPTDISLSGSTIAEGNAPDALVATLTATDPDTPPGSFFFSLVNGIGADNNALFTIVGNELHVNSTTDFETKASYKIRVRVRDADGLTFDKPFVLQVVDANESPVITPNLAVSMPTLLEDPVSNDGALVRDLFLPGLVTDPDAGALQGIAVVQIGVGAGTWQYSLNGGANWLNIGTVSVTSARLLSADNATRIRFLPNANASTPSALVFHAWDRTVGNNGDLAAATPNGGNTAFSTDVQVVNQEVQAVNDAPVNSVPATLSAFRNSTIRATNGLQIAINDVDAGNQPIKVVLQALSGAGLAIGSIRFGSTSGLSSITGIGTGRIDLVGTQAAINAALASILYTPPSGFTGTITFRTTTNDQGFVGLGGAKVTMSNTTIQFVNRPPVRNTLPAPTFTASVNKAINVPASAGLRNYFQDADQDLLTFQVVKAPTIGKLTVRADGSISFTPPKNFRGTITFSVRAFDGIAFSAASLLVTFRIV